MPLAAGTRLGPYEILSPIGAGGMGEVYRARDTRLDRIVAIKVSSERFSERFAIEARAVAALNHPHICQLYDVGPNYLVMEYVEGKPLSGPLPLEEALRLGAQIAAALDAAHRKGITHRDLKPGNILVTKSGIKLLDFGLAKIARAPAAGMGETAVTQALTEEGTLVGTVQYMSPEQLQGKPAGPASDIFSFGCVLYEMVTGKRAFEATSPASLIAAILEKQPPPVSTLGPVASAKMQRLLDACLAKDPEDRWQSAADLRCELEWLAAPEEATVAAKPKGRRFAWVALLPVVLILGFLVARWFAPARVATYDPVPLTSYPGLESDPALSPDGKLIAFAWSPNYGPEQVYVKQLDASEPLAITRNEAAAHRSPAWSPDGRQIAFIRYRSDGVSLVIVPALGGPERQVGRVQGPAWGLCWLPISNAVVVGAESGRGLVAIPLAGGDRKRLTEPPAGWFDALPKLSPDGGSLAFVRRVGIAGSRSEIYILKLNRAQEPEGPLKLIPAEVRDVSGLDWAPDGRSLIVAALRNGAYRLDRISVPGGAVEMFPGAPAGALEVSICVPARRMAIAVEQRDIDLWRLAGPRWPASRNPPEPERLVASTYEDVSPNYSPDGRRIAFESSRTGSQEIWAVDADGRNAVQLTNFGGPSVGTPRWSPDGSKVAFDSRKFGSTDLFVVGASGGAPVRLTSDPSNETRPTWSSDGRWLFFLSDQTGAREIWKIPAEGGPATQVTQGGAADVQRIAGDTFLYYQREAFIYRMPESGGTAEKVSPAGGGSRWVPCEDGILMYAVGNTFTLDLFRLREEHGSVLRKLPPAGSPRFSRTGNFTVSPDGQWVVLSLTALDRKDLMLIENLR